MEHLRMKEKYVKKAIPQMREKFGYKNALAVPRIEKVIINTGFGRMVAGKNKQEAEKVYKNILDDLALLTGQRPILTTAKKSISGFKLRQGMPVGAKVTLRGPKMYDMLDRLIHIVLPRTRDFFGIKPSAIDKRGALTIGIKEHIVFPEISAEDVRKIFGLEITVVTNAKSREEGIELFRALGFPIKKEEKKDNSQDHA